MRPMMMEWNKAQALINEATRILVVTHVSPDGDAIGSLLGISHALRTYGKTVIPAVDGGVPQSLRFLPGTGDVLSSLDANLRVDLLIAVDCGDKERTGKVGQAGFALNIPSINIDHHRTNSMFGAVNLVDLNTVAASEGVLDLLGHLHIALTLPTAQCLLCGIVTDTLCFRTSNVT